MRIGSFKARIGQVDELLQIYQNEAIPVIKAANGNTAAFILQQHNDPHCLIACTIWKTQEDAENYDKSGQAMEMVNKIRHTFVGPPELTTYESYGI